jgi:arginine:agmatine antiporter
MVVTLIVMAYIAAGLSLMLGTRARPSGRREKLLGLAALVACGLLIYATPVKTLIGSLIVAALVWAAWRAFVPRRT